MPQIVAENLTKSFRIAERDPGNWGAVRGLFRRRYREMRALDGVSVILDALEGCVDSVLRPLGSGRPVPRIDTQPLAGWGPALSFDRQLGRWSSIGTLATYSRLRSAHFRVSVTLRGASTPRGLTSVRIGREEWRNLLAEDVAWVTEWQLAAAFSWVPIGQESRVYADPGPDETGRWWTVSIRLGQDCVTTRLPVRDLARMVQWCHQLQAVESLLQPPSWVRASTLAVQRALRRALHRTNPLSRMGYAGHDLPDRGRGSQGGPDARRS